MIIGYIRNGVKKLNILDIENTNIKIYNVGEYQVLETDLPQPSFKKECLFKNDGYCPANLFFYFESHEQGRFVLNGRQRLTMKDFYLDRIKIEITDGSFYFLVCQ